MDEVIKIVVCIEGLYCVWIGVIWWWVYGVLCMFVVVFVMYC